MDIKKYKEVVKNYRLRVSSRYYSVDAEQIERITPQDNYLVSTKYDGHFYTLVKEKDNVVFINHRGKIIDDLDLIEIAKTELKNHDQIVIPGELYVKQEGRARSFDATKAITDKSDNLCFAAFDCLSQNDELLYEKNAFEIYELLSTIFSATGRLHFAEHQNVESRKEIQSIFDQKVNQEDGEGLVVKGLERNIYKVKPKYTFDAVIVGFAEADGEREGSIRDLLLAFMKEDGSYQIFTHLHHGFSQEKRTELLETLSKKVVDSQYIEVARNKVGFQMIKPEIVLEFSCLDIIVEDSKGFINKANLTYDEEKGYINNFKQQSVSVSSPVFVRFRDDKSVNKEDVRFSQLEEVLSLEETAEKEAVELPASNILKREVYTKESRGSKMVRKFLLIKTNKEHTNEYPAYVFHYTDFSSTRKDPLKQDIKLSNSEEQITSIYDNSIVANIKSGWEKV